MITAEEAPADQAVQSLSDHHVSYFDEYFVQFYFTIHAFGDRRKVRGVEVTYAGQILDNKMVAGGEAKLISEKRLAPVNKARRQLRNYVKHWCLSGGSEGCFCINTVKSEEFFTGFARLRAQLDEETDTLAAALPEILAENREQWRSKMPDDAVYAQRVGKLLPKTPEELRSYYSVEVRLHDKNDPHVSAAMAKYRTGAVRDWFESAHQAAIAHDIEQRRAQYREPILRIQEGLDKFRLQLNQGDRLTPKSFRAFEDSLVLFEACVDIMAPDLVESVRAMAAELASIKGAAKQAAADKTTTFTDAVKAHKQALNTVIGRFVSDCESATSEAAMADRIGRMPRPLRFNMLNQA